MADGEPCNCGRRGCLHTLLTERGLRRAIATALDASERYPDLYGDDDEPDAFEPEPEPEPADAEVVDEDDDEAA